MITFREVAYAVYGTWRLARLDPRGMECFDHSLGGFWRSFFAAVIVAPGYALLVLFRLAETAPQAPELRIFLIEAAAYANTWLAFPFIMLYLTRAFGRERHYVGYIVAYNWSSILQIAAFLPVSTLAAMDPMNRFAQFLMLAVTIAILLYQWYIARTALEVPGLRAAGIVALDTIVGILITGIADGMIARG